MDLFLSAVFRDHKRLASKLTSDELRAIQDYVEERLRAEQADINFKLYALRNDYDVTVRRSSETITELYQELNEKKDIIKHYQTSDQTISAVLKQKEERWEKKQEMLMEEIQKCEGKAALAKTNQEALEKEIEEKNTEIIDLGSRLIEANKVAARVEEAEKIVDERDEGRKEIMRLKMELDRRGKLVDSQEQTIKVLRDDIEQLKKEKKYSELKTNSMQAELKRQVAEVRT